LIFDLKKEEKEEIRRKKEVEGEKEEGGEKGKKPNSGNNHYIRATWDCPRVHSLTGEHNI